MKRTITSIKKNAKRRLHQNFGDAFIIIFVPIFIMYAVSIVLGRMTSFLPDGIELIADYIVQAIIGIITTYVTIRLIIQYIRGVNGVSFDNFFHFEKSFIHLALFRVLITVISISFFIPIIPVAREIMEQMLIMADAEAIQQYLVQSDVLERLVQASLISLGLFILLWIVTIKLQFTPFVIIDEDLTLFQGISRSWSLTKGKFFKVFLFPFTYILWLFVAMTFFGLFYVIPLLSVGYAALYQSLLDDEKDALDIYQSSASTDMEYYE
jgi:uncharacterized membrane protein